MIQEKHSKYDKTLPSKMYCFFCEYSDASGAPSFAKFARLNGITVADLESFRTVKKFERAYIECLEIRRDYLIDRALTKRFDPTFVKYLLSDTNAEHLGEDDDKISVRVEVVE